MSSTHHRLQRQSLIRMYFHQGYRYKTILQFLSTLHGVTLSLKTLKRDLHRMNLRRRGNYDNLGRVRHFILSEMRELGSLLGYRAMHVHLQRKYGIAIQREVVRRLVVRLDIGAVRERRRHRLFRRRYCSKGANFCWHIDRNDKLLPYGFAIHSCVDGFSRKLLWMEVSPTNKNASVVGGYYLSAVECYDKGRCPRLISADLGSENARIAYLQPFLRRNGTDTLAGSESFWCGKSVHQRIERWWRTMRQWCTQWWIDFFRELKSKGHYDDMDFIQRDCLCFVFTDLIQKDLNFTMRTWNRSTHPIRSQRTGGTVGGIPDELFYLPHLKGYDDCTCEVNPLDIQFCGQYVSSKPEPTIPQFSQLAKIIMEEDHLSMPTTVMEGFKLYLTLVDKITQLR